MHMQNSIKQEEKGEVQLAHPPDLYYLAVYIFLLCRFNFMQMFAFFPYVQMSRSHLPFKDVLSSNLI